MSGMKDKDKRTGRTDSARSFFKPLEGIERLKADPVLEAIDRERPSGTELYLVGGVLRNFALGIPAAPDYDFALDGDTKAFAARMADRLGGAYFALDIDAGAWRVVSRRGGALTIDFTPLAQGDLLSDLKKRDFTVNAMAVSVAGLLQGERSIVDPFNGIEDARARNLRKVSDSVFDDDPLRSMRAVRLATQYGLTIERQTRELILDKASLLTESSPERVRDELVSLMACANSFQGISLLHDTGLLYVIVPEMKGWDDISGYDLLSHSFSVLREADRLLENISDETFPGLAERLKEHLLRPGPVPSSVLFRLAALFHDFGKAYTLTREARKLRFIGHDSEGAAKVSEVMERLRFSRKTSSELALLVKNHHRTFMLAALDKRTFRAKGHFFRVMGGEPGLMLLCLALCDARATRGGEDPELYGIALEMMRFYYDVFIMEKPEPLMTGSQVMETFHLPEGPLVGRILAKIGEGVETGLVTNRKEAVSYVRKWLKGEQKKRDTG